MLVYGKLYLCNVSYGQYLILNLYDRTVLCTVYCRSNATQLNNLVHLAFPTNVNLLLLQHCLICEAINFHTTFFQRWFVEVYCFDFNVCIDLPANTRR